jgi:hypothetical protein
MLSENEDAHHARLQAQAVDHARSEMRRTMFSRRTTALAAVATAILVGVVLLVAGCGGSRHTLNQAVTGGVPLNGSYNFATFDDCLAFNYSSNDYTPGQNLEDLTAAAVVPQLAQLAYSTGEGAFSSEGFPPSVGMDGSAFYGFASAKAAKAALDQYKHAIMTTPLPSSNPDADGAFSIDYATADEVWLRGNIIVVGVPQKLHAVDQAALDSCFAQAAKS